MSTRLVGVSSSLSTRRGGAFAIAVSVLLLAACGAAGGSDATATGSASSGSTATGPSAAGPAASSAATLAPSSTSSSEGAVPTPSASPAGPPLWPFADAAAATAWSAAHKAGAVDDWHLDAAATAQRFARDFLGYTELDKITSKTESATRASIGVGSAGDGSVFTAGTIDLVRTDASAPWQVVGTQDRDLVLTSPAAGAAAPAAGSPLTVAGLITGVDESLHVLVLTLPRTLVGEVKGISAGGEQQPWTASVPLTGTATGPVTVAVSTGGHLQRVEKFAVRGLRAG